LLAQRIEQLNARSSSVAMTNSPVAARPLALLNDEQIAGSEAKAW
jgi:hypothetical protein